MSDRNGTKVLKKVGGVLVIILIVIFGMGEEDFE